jgi:SagB-type dehydrogenase family enzyme
LSSFFWLSCKTQKNAESDIGLPLAQRPVPSAGALHPIHVLINQPSDSNWWRYDHDDHSLKSVERSNVLSDLRLEAETLVETGDGALLLLVAEPGKSFAKYENATGLIWRDAGVLLGQFSLVSEALGLNFCALGITGAPWASDLDETDRLAGVGLGILGSPI